MAAAPVLLVTGASRGIGAATARLAAARGYDVGVNYVSDRKSADEVVAAVTQAGRRAVAIQADMGKEADIDRMFEELDQKLGRVTHLVYNTGITGPMSRVDGADPKVWREVFDVNVIGAFLAVKHAVQRMSVKHGGQGGAMVLISSAMATLGGANEYIWYAASKGAIESMTVGLARELAPDKIRVNSVAPGPVLTGIHPPGRLERIIPNVPMGRAGEPEEIAEAILFLLSEQSSWTDGVVLRVAGGR
jgi:NAD(P)-dependent dehydrogenase (short-subunit alcohol dehydrogenase family)